MARSQIGGSERRIARANPRKFQLCTRLKMAEQKLHNPTPEELDAQNYGIDLSLIEHNLSLSIEKRLEQHQGALEVVLELQAAKKRFDQEQEDNERSKHASKTAN